MGIEEPPWGTGAVERVEIRRSEDIVSFLRRQRIVY